MLGAKGADYILNRVDLIALKSVEKDRKAEFATRKGSARDSAVAVQALDPRDLSDTSQGVIEAEQILNG